MASKYLQKYPVPDGFNQILHDFAREVLRDQPDDIIQYGADYFECMRLGKEFKFESKFNIAKGQAPGKQYKPPKPSDLSAQAKQVVDTSNQRPPTQPRIQSGTVRQPSRQNPNDISHASHASSKGSHPEEKQAAHEYVNEVYSKVEAELQEDHHQEDQQEEEQQEQQEQLEQQEQQDQQEPLEQEQVDQNNNQQTETQQPQAEAQAEQMLSAADFNEDQMQKLIKIQAAAKGTIARGQMKDKKKQQRQGTEENQVLSPSESQEQFSKTPHESQEQFNKPEQQAEES
ncbi:hypothetical protein pb186bvf_014606 [Paramecium bursaria]